MIIDCKQGDAAWHALRSKSLGATSASVLANVNPYKNKLDLYNEMVLGHVTPLNDAMRRGMDMEGQALKYCENKLQESFSNVTMRHPKMEYMHASFDGINFGGTLGVEIKCPGEKAHRKTCETLEIPVYYRWQMQQQMCVGGLKEMWYCSYMSDDDAVLLHIVRDDKMIGQIEENAHDFYFFHILPTVPPVIKPKRVDVSEEDSSRKLRLEMNFRNRRELKEKVKYLEGLIDCLDEVIISDCEGESIELGEFKCTKYVRKGTIEYDKIPELKGVSLESYRKESVESWRIS